MTTSTSSASTSPHLSPLGDTPNQHAMEAAFAELPHLAIRFDRAEEKSSVDQNAEETKRLIAKIGDQFAAIQQQRDRLVRLLNDLNIACDA